MSRIFSVFAVFVVQFGLISTSAFGLNYHVDSKNTQANDGTNVYYAFFCTQDATKAHLVLPTNLGSSTDSVTRLILYNDDATTAATGYGRGPKSISLYGGNVTVQSNDSAVTRKLAGTDSTLFHIENWGVYHNYYDPLQVSYNYGGILTISPDVQFFGSTISGTSTGYAVIRNGYSSGSGQGNLEFQNGAPFLEPYNVRTKTAADGSIDVYTFIASNTFNAERVTFSNNITAYTGTVYSAGTYRDSTFVAVDGNTYNYHDTAIAINTLNRAVFSNNESTLGSGGSFYSDAWSQTEANNARFVQNKANFGGGAIYAYKSILSAQGSDTLFSENSANNGSGGAISSHNSALYLKSASFQGNNALMGSGGAVYFMMDDGFSYDLALGAYEGTTANFLQNQDFYGANSIVFAGNGTALVHVDVERHGALNMIDPMRVQANTGLSLVIDKTGEGVWTLGGVNNLQAASIGTKIDIREGTFQLYGGSALNMTHTLGLDSLNFQPGTVFTVGDAVLPGTASSIATTKLSLASNTTMTLNDSLTLNLTGNDSTIGSTLSGRGNLTKAGVGTLTFTGTTNKFTGNVNINAGTFAVGADKQLSTSGKFVVNTGSTLSIVVDAQRPTIVVGQADLSGARIEIAGVSGKSDADFVIVKSSSSIIHTTDPTPVYDGSTTMPNYLRTAFGFRDANGVRDAEYAGTVGLTWYANDGTENGLFTLERSSSKFTVNTDLVNVRSKNPDWKDNSLTKDGKGTLELAVDNTYSGKTTVKDGTLLLTHANGTGSGNSAVQVDASGTLALDFQYGNERDYGRQITGQGKVSKQGDSTIKLTNTDNNYSGGTEIQRGILQFDDGKVFGNGLVAFIGGTLQNTTETTLTQAVSMEKDHFARFDTPEDLTVSGGISGVGGLVKTGVGTLTLTGTNPYQGETRFEEGTVVISRWDNLGSGRLVFDGGSFRNTGNDVTLGNDVRLEKGRSGIITGAANTNLTLSGTVSGEGTLVKNGDASSTLTLNGVNHYSGGTLINSGTVAIAGKESLGTGIVTFAGGTLKNTRSIDGLSQNITINPGVQAAFDVAEHDMNVASKISGSGGLTKTGGATLTLSGANTYSGKTIVQEGVLAVNGRIQSFVEVEKGAALTGTGTVGRNVNFLDGSAYRWNFNRTEADSPYLHIAGDVYLKNAYFQAVTAGDVASYPNSVDGWTVLAYDGVLLGDGRFVVDDSFCPFVDIALDYDTDGQVKLIAHNRHDPRALSDIMAASLLIAQRKMNRRPFEQIDNELRHGRYVGSEPIRLNRRQEAGTTRGQARGVSKNLWGNMTGRTSNYASTCYTDDQWKLNSFGVQGGYSFLSTNWMSLGITGGAEFPELKNGYDKIDASDGYLGLYYGQRVFGMWEMKGFLGGGLQKYKMLRRDALYTYQSKYHGDSFETNIELARPFLLGNWMLRPYVGFDLEYASQAGSVESESSTEFRTYSGTSLTQMFLRVGMDFEKRLERGDFIFGIGYANMIGGQSVPNVYVYYPFAKKGVTSYGAEMGHNVISLHLGGNRYINSARTKALFLDYTAEIFCDRDGGASQHNFAFGYSYRF